MGLDNGVLIKGKTIKGKKLLAEKFNLLEEYGNEYELFYARKCWNIRHRFLDVFKDKEYDGNGGEFRLDVAELYDVVEHILKYFLDEDNWLESEGSSIWTWEEMIPQIARAIYNIRNFMEEFEYEELSEEDFEITFYDSY